LLGHILFLRPIKRQAAIEQVDRFRVADWIGSIAIGVA
jgi:hypothetical protein